jgi:glyoxylase-like metal-dependent hydrolase (beta-lactamase superfamily II)
MELDKGIHIIETSFWERPLQLVLVVGSEQVVLVDTGVPETPREAIIPYMKSIGLSPEDLSLVVVTHAHVDHFGGSAELWSASGQRAQIAAHPLEAPYLEDPEGHTRKVWRRYVEAGLADDELVEKLIQASGKPVKVNPLLKGGELFQLGDGLELEIIFVPGHSPGSIAALERKNKVLIQGETLSGVALFDTEGRPVLTGWYEDLEAYLKTIADIASMDWELFVPSHNRIMKRADSVRFFEESLDFAIRFDEEVIRRLKDADEPITAVELWRSIGSLWGLYPFGVATYILLETHIPSLIEAGLVTGSMKDGLSWIGPDRDRLAPLVQEARTAIRGLCN